MPVINLLLNRGNSSRVCSDLKFLWLLERDGRRRWSWVLLSGPALLLFNFRLGMFWPPCLFQIRHPPSVLVCYLLDSKLAI